jgi:hypothetical protein
MTVFPRTRRRLSARFKPIVDGLFDKARDAAANQPAEPEISTGQWARSRPNSTDIEIIEAISGNPASLLGYALDSVHRGDIQSIALVGIGPHGVIHTAFSRGDLELMGVGAGFLSSDLKSASDRTR